MEPTSISDNMGRCPLPSPRLLSILAPWRRTVTARTPDQLGAKELRARDLREDCGEGEEQGTSGPETGEKGKESTAMVLTSLPCERAANLAFRYFFISLQIHTVLASNFDGDVSAWFSVVGYNKKKILILSRQCPFLSVTIAWSI